MITIVKQKRYWLYAVNLLAFAGISIMNSQMIPYLTSLGYSIVERGYILALNAIIAIVGQFLFGYICDRFKKIKIFFLWAYLLFLISGFAMYMIQHKLFYYHLLTVSMMAGMVKVIMGLNETWMLEVDEEHYGKLRSMGALGMTIGSPLAGYVLHRFSYKILLIVFFIISCLLFICIYKSKDARKRNQADITFASMKALWCNSPYRVLVCIYLFIYIIGTADQYVVIDKMQALHASTTAIGMKWALQSFMEIPLFLFASKILQRFKPITLLMAGTLLYGVKFFLYALSTTPWAIILTASLQLVTLPVVMLTSKVMIKAVTPEEVCSSAQMFAMAVFVGVSGLITPLITAYLAKQFGYTITLYTVAIFSIVPFLCILYYKKRYKT